MRSLGKDIPPKTCFILPCIFKCVGTISELSTKLSQILFEIDFHFNMADRRLRRHLSQDEMNRGIGMLHSGLSQRHVANVLGVSQSVVSRMWNRFITTVNVGHLHAGGRERSTNEVQDRFLWWFRHGATDLTTQQRYVGTSRTLPVCA